MLAAIVGAVAGIGMVTGWHTEETNKRLPRTSWPVRIRSMRRRGNCDEWGWMETIRCGIAVFLRDKFDMLVVMEIQVWGMAAVLVRDKFKVLGNVKSLGLCIAVFMNKVYVIVFTEMVGLGGIGWQLGKRECSCSYVQFAFEIVGEIKRCWNVPELV